MVLHIEKALSPGSQKAADLAEEKFQYFESLVKSGGVTQDTGSLAATGANMRSDTALIHQFIFEALQDKITHTKSRGDLGIDHEKLWQMFVRKGGSKQFPHDTQTTVLNRFENHPHPVWSVYKARVTAQLVEEAGSRGTVCRSKYHSLVFVVES